MPVATCRHLPRSTPGGSAAPTPAGRQRSAGRPDQQRVLAEAARRRARCPSGPSSAAAHAVGTPVERAGRGGHHGTSSSVTSGAAQLAARTGACPRIGGPSTSDQPGPEDLGDAVGEQWPGALRMVAESVEQRQLAVRVQLTGVRPDGLHLQRPARSRPRTRGCRPAGRSGARARCHRSRARASARRRPRSGCRRRPAQRRRYCAERAGTIGQHHAEQIGHACQSAESRLPSRKCRVPNIGRNSAVPRRSRRRRLPSRA